MIRSDKYDDMWHVDVVTSLDWYQSGISWEQDRLRARESMSCLLPQLFYCWKLGRWLSLRSCVTSKYLLFRMCRLTWKCFLSLCSYLWPHSIFILQVIYVVLSYPVLEFYQLRCKIFNQFSNLRFGWMEDGNPDGRGRRAGLHHQLPESQPPHHLLLQGHRIQPVRHIRALHQWWDGKWSLCQVFPTGKLKFLLLQNYFAICKKKI